MTSRLEWIVQEIQRLQAELDTLVRLSLENEDLQDLLAPKIAEIETRIRELKDDVS